MLDKTLHTNQKLNNTNHTKTNPTPLVALVM